MRNFHIRSILLGIGIGFIITSVLGLIYSAGNDPYRNLSEEETARLAAKYGLVRSSSVIDGSGRATDSGVPASAAALTAGDAAPVQTVGTPPPAALIQISIKQGDTSETVADKLFRAGLIKDKQAFVKQLDDTGLSDKISVGEFKIPSDYDVKRIINVITRS